MGQSDNREDKIIEKIKNKQKEDYLKQYSNYKEKKRKCGCSNGYKRTA